jgi:predicted deacetylase
MESKYFLVALIIIIPAMAIISSDEQPGSVDLKPTGLTKNAPGGPHPEIWIEIHDVGANYDLEEFQKVIDVLERHPKTCTKLVLMVIPNYHGEYPFNENPEFVTYLNELEDRGYVLGIHGYTHIGEEFNVSGKEAGDIIQRADEDFSKNGFEHARVFLPPRWKYTPESLEVGLERFDEFYADNGIYINDSFYRYPVHEYTADSMDFAYEEEMLKAKNDYKNSDEVFRFSMHLAFASSEKHLRLLDEFLNWTKENSS